MKEYCTQADRASIAEPIGKVAKLQFLTERKNIRIDRLKYAYATEAWSNVENISGIFLNNFYNSLTICSICRIIYL